MNLKFYKNFLSICCLFLVLGISNLSAQTVAGGYAFSQQTGTYTEITGGTVLGSGEIDDNSYTNQAIGFTFVYNGVSYTSFSVNANGFMALGTTITSSYTSISSGTTNNVIAGLNFDLEGLAANGELRFETIGTAPNRKLVVQFKNWAAYPSPTNVNDNFNFQFILEETSNIVSIQYGSMLKNSASAGAQVGLRGASNADFNNRSTTTDWSATTSGAVNTATCTFANTIFPSSGLTLVWTPIQIAAANPSVSPAGPTCTATAHTVSVDVAGVPDIAAVTLNYSVNGVAQTPVAMSLASGTAAAGTWTGTIPPASGTGVLTVAYTFSVSNVIGQNGGPYAGGSYTENYLGVNAGPDQVLGVGLTTTLTASANDPALFPVVFSEITHFETGTGATTSYPAYTQAASTDWDGLEIQNIHATNPVNIGGLIINIWTSATVQTNYTIPANTIIPAGGVAVFSYNNVASDPANLFFSMGGITAQPSSASNYGYILKTATGAILDVVGTGTFAFPAASGVTAANWSGNIPSASGRAGVVRIGATDTNTAADWAISNTVAAGGPIQTIGTFNSAIAQVNTTAGAFSWTPGGATTSSIVVGPFTPGTYTYTVSYSDGSCTQSDDVSILIPDCPAPTSFAVSAVIDTAATFSWVSGGGTVDSTIVEYGPVGFVPGTGTQVIVATNPATVTSFLPNTSYEAYIFESCDATAGNSFYSNMVSFTTTCSPNPYFGNTLAAPIVASSFPFTYTLNAAEWSCYTSENANRASRDVFFQFTADSCASSATVQLCNSSVAWDTYLTILASNGTTTVITSDDVCGAHPNVTFTVQPGVTYYAMVEPYATTGTPTNPFTIDITQTLGTPEPATSITVVDASCLTSSDGSASVLVTNTNKGPVTYLWSTGATTSSVAGLLVGSYFVTTSNGCGGSKVDTVSINSSFDLQVSNQTNVQCNGENSGAIDVSVSGGVLPYTFAWDNGASSEDLANLTAGTYNLSLTDAGGCQLSTSVTITEPSPIVVAVDTINAVACNGAADGSIALSVSGGTNLPPVPNSLTTLFATNNGCTNGNMFNVTVNTDMEITGFDISMGTTSGPVVIYYKTGAYQGFETTPGAWTQIYTGTHTGLGTNVPTPVSLGASLPLAAGSYAFYVNADLDYTNIASGTLYSDANMTISSGAGFCTAFTGAIDGRAWNGTINYTLPGATYTYLWSNGLTTEDATGLAAGSYTLEITDGNSCVYVTPSIPVTEPSALSIDLVQASDVSCNGGTDGTAEVVISGGTLPYTHLWSNGDVTSLATGLMAGSYTDTVMDANGCSLVVGPIAVAEPTLFSVVLDSSASITACAGDTTGAIFITASGGTAPYTYAWSNGSNTEDIQNLAAGDYTGTFTDDKGCTFILGPITLTEPAPLSVANLVVTNVACFGDSTASIDLSVAGGTAPYTYAWSNGATSEDLTALAAGSYDGLVTDANGCTLASGAIAVTEPASALTYVTTNMEMVSCNGAADGAIAILVEGGTMPYAYAWSNGDSVAAISNLSGGVYSATITDANACVFVGTGDTLLEPAALVATATATQMSSVGANDGAIALDVTGGVAPYTYNWSDGSTGTGLSGLSGGTYGVVVVDANGCFTTATASITVLTSIKDIDGVSAFEIYPNPTSDFVNINLSLEELQEVNFELYSMDGKLMTSQSFGNTKQAQIKLDLSNYASGIYLTKVLIGKEVLVDRIVVNK